MTNTELWDKLGRTDPAHTKNFTRGGGFRGTAIKPMWSYRRMTEEFGPCGTGWGIGAPQFQVLQGADDEKLVFCTVTVWYGPERHELVGVGGDKAVGKFSSGLKSDDEAFKKSFTDAVTNALKMIGVGADVHMGMFDDSKYVNSLKDEFAEPANKGQKRQVGWNASGTARTAHSLKKEGVWDEFQMELRECETLHSLTKLALIWSKKAEDDKWPEQWRELAKEEINKRKDALKVVPDDDTFPGDRPSTRTNILAGG